MFKIRPKWETILKIDMLNQYKYCKELSNLENRVFLNPPLRGIAYFWELLVVTTLSVLSLFQENPYKNHIQWKSML